MSVEKTPDGWLYECPDCGFESTRHPTKASASKRGAEHRAEHERGAE
jgi:hypothetical protein